MLAHGLSELKNISVSQKEGTIYFVEKCCRGNSQRVRKIDSLYVPEQDVTLRGISFVTQGAGDPYGNIQITNVKPMGIDQILVYRHTYLTGSDTISIITT